MNEVKKCLNDDYLWYKRSHNIVRKERHLERWFVLCVLYFYYFIMRKTNFFVHKETKEKEVTNLNSQTVSCNAYVTLHISISDLIRCQIINGEYHSYDLSVRYKVINEILNKVDNNQQLWVSIYEKLQLKSSNLSWTNRFVKLIESVQENGMNEDVFVTVNDKMIIMDGAHRLMLAMSMGEEYINIRMYKREYYRPWNKEWFWSRGFSSQECNMIWKATEEMFYKLSYPFYIVVFPSVLSRFDDICKELKEYDPKNIIVDSYRDFKLSEWSFKGIVKALYYEDVISEVDLEKKIANLIATSEIQDNSYGIRVIKCSVREPDFVVRKETMLPQSMTMKRMKLVFRERYKQYVSRYIYDVVIHSSDNYIQSKLTESIFEINTDVSDLMKCIGKYEYCIIKYKDSRQDRDFPEKFYIHSDVDILIKAEDLNALTEYVYEWMSKNYSNMKKYLYSVELIDNNGSKQIRLNYKGFLIFCVHIQTTAYFGMRDNYNEVCLNNRIRDDKGIYFLPIEYDIFFRLVEYIRKPNKFWHAEYISIHQLDIDKDIFNLVFDDRNDLAERVRKYVNSLDGRERYCKDQRL
ncbi:MAG: hypothetical protein K5868_02605 [Lachnospiraceae bacterium]|nr:hypothetical protein [Lachnospiraceae bacterium]